MPAEQTQPEVTPAQTAQARYEQLGTERNPYLQRGRDAAELTLPSLLPHEGSSGATDLPTPYQSVGARGVDNLAAKLLLALFPPGTSFFKLDVDEFVLEQLKMAGADEDTVGEMQKNLSKIERGVVRRLEQKNVRTVMFGVFKHLLVAGNALVQVLKDGALKFHPLTNYVVKRDLEGTPVEILVKESLSRRTLPAAARVIVERKSAEAPQDVTKNSLDLYTWITRKGIDGSWRVHQEIIGERIPGTEGFYPAEKSAWLPLRWSAVPNEDYGRGRVEEYLGDLRSFEALSQALVDFAGAASKLLIFVNESGVTSKQLIAEAPSGAVVDGDAKDVTMLSMEKFADFRVTKEQADEIKQRLEQAFLLTSSIQRDAERVTAEEIRVMAAELEQSLGGVYSVFSQELQRPLVVRVMFNMQRAGELPHLPEKAINAQIVTGLAGLGRTSDLARLDAFVAGLAQTFGPEALAEYVNVGAYATRRAAALSIDVTGLVRSEDEVQKARQQQLAAKLADKLGPAAIKGNTDRDVAAQKAAQTAQPQQ